MDLTNVDMNALAAQLRKPEGDYGREVAAVMAQKNDAVIAFTLECLGVRPTDHILEIGFGPGEGIARAAQLTPEGFVAGVDYSPDMLTMAAERNAPAIARKHVELRLGNARELPYEDERFDALFAVNVFHFWPHAAQELAECYRVLKPGGRAAFFMAYPSSWLPGLKESGVFIAREPDDVTTLLADAGFIHTSHRTIVLGEFRGFAAAGEKA